MKVLLITYYYPPMGGAGVQRALKFSKYLREFGIEPVVLCAHDPAYTQDTSLLADVPAGLKVVRVPFTPLLQRLLQRWSARRRTASAATPSTSATSATARPARSGLRDAVLAAHATLVFPDDRAAWARRALAPALALLRDERIELIFSTAPPVSAHALAARLARVSGLPWVADYRDLWADNPAYAAPAWRRAIDRRTEADWLRRAAGVVTVTPSWQRRFEVQLGPGRPVRFIPNGYDEADFAGLQPAPRSDGAFRLLHTGSFYGPRDPATLLDGVSRYLQQAPAGARPLVLRFVGNVGSRFAAPMAAFAAQHPGVLEHQAYVPHHDALAEMLAADALLLVVGAGVKTGAAAADVSAVVAGTLPGKIFEYLRAGRPMLLLGDAQGDAAQLLRAHGAGWVADETDAAQIAAALQHLLQPGAAPLVSVAPAGARIADFERRALSGQLAQFLRERAAARPGPAVLRGGPHG